MVNINLHKRVFIDILREIYTDSLLRTALGFKGGSAAMLFYGLPRFSVDLDFDLLNTENKDAVLKRLKEILPSFGKLSEATEKRFTLFFLLNYRLGERNVKIEISKRPIKSEFKPKNYLGISMLVMTKQDMAAGKWAALLTRRRFASRDVFDLWFFLKQNWPIDENSLEKKSGMNLTQAIFKARERIKKIKKTELLSGLGELLDNRQKNWVRDKLIEEKIFYLDLYRETKNIPKKKTAIRRMISLRGKTRKEEEA